ncbi:MAG: hypothetical protein ABJK20_13740, partial [Halieaceae bacterium]
MEPIRPDDDEVRTGEPGNNVEERKKREAPVRESAGNGGPDKPAGRSRKASGGGGSGRSAVLLIALLIVAGAAGAGWYQQEQRIQALEGQLEEADYWARQSKLALARFEGELSETGENLQERGQSIEETLVSHKERLNTADSEIAKLWGVANDRNRKRLDEHKAELESLRADLDSGSGQREALSASFKKLDATVSSRLDKVQSDLERQLTAVRETGQE